MATSWPRTIYSPIITNSMHWIEFALAHLLSFAFISVVQTSKLIEISMHFIHKLNAMTYLSVDDSSLVYVATYTTIDSSVSVRCDAIIVLLRCGRCDELYLSYIQQQQQQLLIPAVHTSVNSSCLMWIYHNNIWSWFVHGSSMPSVHHARPLIVSNLLYVQLFTHSSLTHTRLCIVLAGSDNQKKKYQSKFADHIGHRRKWIRLLIKNRMKRSFLIHLMDQQLSPHSATIQTLVVPVLMVYRPNFMFSPPFFFYYTFIFHND